MSESKEILRHEALRHRSLIDASTENMDAVADFFFETIKPPPGQVIAAYWPSKKEFAPFAILERLLAEKFVCALPVVEKNSKVLKFAQWEDGDPLNEGMFGVSEPLAKKWVDPDILILPMLAFDRRGFRLGYGGGYYDVTLRDMRARKKVTAVGLGFAQQAVLFNLPVEDHDEKLDYMITPQGVHKFD